MSHKIIEYVRVNGDSEGAYDGRTVVFVPGYTGGLAVATLAPLIEHYSKRGGHNVFGLALDYQADECDVFGASQADLVAGVNEIAGLVSPASPLTLITKSLGGSLVLFNLARLPAQVTGVVVLGCSVKLGWPQRVSLRHNEPPQTPNYQAEWRDTLANLATPTLILSGDADHLTDNEYLATLASQNPNLQLTIIEQADHHLTHPKTSKLHLPAIQTALRAFEVWGVLL